MTESADTVRMDTTPINTARIIWRSVHTQEASSVLAVHLEALAGMEPGMVRPDTLEHFVSHTGRFGEILGGFAEGAGLIAYGVLGTTSETAKHMADLLEIDASQLRRFCILDGAASRPAWRGQNLHRELIRERLAHAAQTGRTLIGATVAPNNLASLRGLLQMQFRVEKFAVLYGGLTRLVLVRDMLAPAASWKLEHKVACEDVRGHEHALAEGLKGFDCLESGNGGWCLHYGYCQH